MSKGERVAMEPQPLPDTRHGVRLWRLTTSGATDGRRQYAPYFYNPHLDPPGHRLLFLWQRGGAEQVWLLDRRQGVATQLTAAQGQGQCWAPYIKADVRGVRPQFFCWSQPDWQHAIFWEGNRLCRVHVETLEEEVLYTLAEDRVPMVPHCSAAGWLAWGYMPAALQARLRAGTPLRQLLAHDAPFRREISGGRCGFLVYDLEQRRLVMDVSTPFWPNHVQASPDNRWVLFCQEGPWDAQRMHLLDAATGTDAPLRPQEGGVAIGHEFWMSPTRVGYHGSVPDSPGSVPEATGGNVPAAGTGGGSGAKRGFFGQIDVQTSNRTEIFSAGTEQYYSHYHAAPDGSAVATDGEVTMEWLSIAPLQAQTLDFAPVARHGWRRRGDQRVHPHPHWHASGRLITFTGVEQEATPAEPAETTETHVLLAEVAPPGADMTPFA
jgi:hypothetical protein